MEKKATGTNQVFGDKVIMKHEFLSVGTETIIEGFHDYIDGWHGQVEKQVR